MGNPKCVAFVEGYTEAERHFYEMEVGNTGEDSVSGKDFINPFREGTEQHRGFEEGVYDFTQK